MTEYEAYDLAVEAFSRARIVCYMVDGFGEAWERPGAMFWWQHGARKNVHGDTAPGARPMPHLAVTTPLGVFCIDCPASGGGHWSRTGEPPFVTVDPSIRIWDNRHEWHGWLKDGVLAQ